MLLSRYPLVPSSSPTSPGSPLVLSNSPASPKLPLSLPLLPPLKPASSSALSPLVPISPSAHPHSVPSGCSDPPQDFQCPALLRHEDLLSLPPNPGLHLGPSTRRLRFGS
ncbi:U6 snRNA phosphodiesterase [Labeo rohita]|uniref:U6 snRNA phosphodiesterase n=1 Tax=Labeo rohita TaxID=84645 RepID=A0ABQ8MAE1_LABRO|nr:U6 snRNA phosphodiesterase [Labeo rohita]